MSERTFGIIFASIAGVIVILGCYFGAPRNNYARETKLKDAATRVAVLTFVTDAERFIAKHGRIPADESELLAFRGRPFPRTGWGDPITYKISRDGQHFIIDTITDGFVGRIYSYYSDTPEKGIIYYLF